MAKAIYVGVTREIPTYSGESFTNVSITSSNISQYFTVSNSAYYFRDTGNGTFESNNSGEDGSTAQTILTAKYNMTVSMNIAYGTETNYDKFTARFGSTTIFDEVTGTGSQQFRGDIPAGGEILFKYTKDGSQSSNGDACRFYGMTVTGTSQVQTGTEIKSVATKVKSIYAGVNNTAKKIKKIYIGIDGVAKLVWRGDGALNPDIDYHQTLHHQVPVYANKGASLGTSYAIFAQGGYAYNNVETGYSKVIAYDSSLTPHEELDDLPTGVMAGAMAGNSTRVLVAGGYGTSGISDRVTRYDSSLNKSNLTRLSSGRCNLIGTVAGDVCIIFAGGDNDSGGVTSKTYYNTVDVYVNGDSKNTLTSLSVANTRMAAEHVGGTAIFTGGAANGGCNIVDIYNSSLSKSSLPGLSETKYSHSATYTKDRKYAIFAGGAGTVNSASVDAFDAQLTCHQASPLAFKRFFMAATHLGGYAMFAGGISEGVRYTLVDTYDNSLTRTICTPLAVARNNFAAASAGKFALFVGGFVTGTGYNDTIDVYKYNK